MEIQAEILRSMNTILVRGYYYDQGDDKIINAEIQFTPNTDEKYILKNAYFAIPELTAEDPSPGAGLGLTVGFGIRDGLYGTVDLSTAADLIAQESGSVTKNGNDIPSALVSYRNTFLASVMSTPAYIDFLDDLDSLDEPIEVDGRKGATIHLTEWSHGEFADLGSAAGFQYTFFYFLFEKKRRLVVPKVEDAINRLAGRVESLIQKMEVWFKR